MIRSQCLSEPLPHGHFIRTFQVFFTLQMKKKVKRACNLVFHFHCLESQRSLDMSIFFLPDFLGPDEICIRYTLLTSFSLGRLFFFKKWVTLQIYHMRYFLSLFEIKGIFIQQSIHILTTCQILKVKSHKSMGCSLFWILLGYFNFQHSIQ